MVLSASDRLVEEICSLWSVPRHYSIEIRRNPQQECPVTIPQLREEQLSRIVIEHPHDITQDWDTILYHEGAHVHLFCNRGYPPSELASLDNVEIIAEYYASKMELEKRFPGQNDRQTKLETKLSDCYFRAINPLLSERDSKRAAVEVTICVQICKDWGLYNSTWIVSARSAESNLRTVPNLGLRRKYEKAAGILEKVPREFEQRQATHIRRLQEEWFRDP
jgi:hypothetical protein